MSVTHDRAFFLGDKANQLASKSTLFYLSQSWKCETFRRLIQLCDPPKICFERIRLFGNIIAIKAIAHFKTQCVSRTQTDCFERLADRFTGIENCTPDLVCNSSMLEPDLETWFTGVTRAGNTHIDAREFAVCKMIVFDLAEIDIGQRLQYGLCAFA